MTCSFKEYTKKKKIIKNRQFTHLELWNDRFEAIVRLLTPVLRVPRPFSSPNITHQSIRHIRTPLSLISAAIRNGEPNAFNLEVRARSNKKKRMKEAEWSFHIVIDPTSLLRTDYRASLSFVPSTLKRRMLSISSCQDFNCMEKAIEMRLSLIPCTELKRLSSLNLF